MNSMTIKLPSQLDQAVVDACKREHVSKSELVRRALASYVSQRHTGTPPASALERSGDLVGCFTGGPKDLSSNPAHMDGFGQV